MTCENKTCKKNDCEKVKVTNNSSYFIKKFEKIITHKV